MCHPVEYHRSAVEVLLRNRKYCRWSSQSASSKWLGLLFNKPHLQVPGAEVQKDCTPMRAAQRFPREPLHGTMRPSIEKAARRRANKGRTCLPSHITNPSTNQIGAALNTKRCRTMYTNSSVLVFTIHCCGGKEVLFDCFFFLETYFRLFSLQWPRYILLTVFGNASRLRWYTNTRSSKWTQLFGYFERLSVLHIMTTSTFLQPQTGTVFSFPTLRDP